MNFQRGQHVQVGSVTLRAGVSLAPTETPSPPLPSPPPGPYHKGTFLISHSNTHSNQVVSVALNELLPQAANLAWMGPAPYSSYSARVNHKPDGMFSSPNCHSISSDCQRASSGREAGDEGRGTRDLCELRFM